jgi:hypothetical protein
MILPKTGRVYQSKSETVSDFSALDHSDGHRIMRLERCGRRRRPGPRLVCSAIPKPSTWVGLLVGFSALGFAGLLQGKVSAALSTA